MGRNTTTVTTPALDVEALIASIASTVTSQVLAQLGAGTETPAAETAPVETTRQKNARLKREAKAKAEKAAAAEARKAEFFGAIKDPQNKADNADLAQWCRDNGYVPNGRVWKAVKEGKHLPADLAPLAVLDKADRDARKAARDAEKATA